MDKRYVEGAWRRIVNVLDYFEIGFDEGAAVDGEPGGLRSLSSESAGGSLPDLRKAADPEGSGLSVFPDGRGIVRYPVETGSGEAQSGNLRKMGGEQRSLL